MQQYCAEHGKPLPGTQTNPALIRMYEQQHVFMAWLTKSGVQGAHGGKPHGPCAYGIADLIPYHVVPDTNDVEYYLESEGRWCEKGGERLLRGEHLECVLTTTYSAFTWQKMWNESKGKVQWVPVRSNPDVLLSDTQFKRDVSTALTGRECPYMPPLDSAAEHKVLYANGMLVDFSKPFDEQVRLPVAQDRLSRKTLAAYVSWEEDMVTRGIFHPGSGLLAVTQEQAEFRVASLLRFCKSYDAYVRSMRGEVVDDRYEQEVIRPFQRLIWTREEYGEAGEEAPSGPLPLCPMARYIFYGISEEEDLAIYMLVLLAADISGMRIGLEECT